jgi:hypothetical protein
MQALFLEALAPYKIPIFKDPVATHELHHLIQQISQRVFGQPATLQVPSIPMHMGQILPENRISNFYNVSAEDTVTKKPYSLVMLYAQIGNACVCLDIRSTGRAQLMYHHGTEDVWLFHDGTFVLYRMVHHLRSEWAILEKQLADKLPNQELTLPEVMAGLQSKVNKIFDHEAAIPNGAKHFYRDPDFPVSRLMVKVDDYQMNFINTKGEYANRAQYLTKGMEGVMSTKVELSELSPLVQTQIIKAVDSVCNDLIDTHIEPKAPVESAAQPFKFKNPVYDMYYGHRSKG